MDLTTLWSDGHLATQSSCLLMIMMLGMLVMSVLPFSGTVMVLGILGIPGLLKMTNTLGRRMHTKMIEYMVRHVERYSNNRYWKEDINKLTEGQHFDTRKDERHDAYRRQQKDERHDTKWKYRERVEGEGYRSVDTQEEAKAQQKDTEGAHTTNKAKQ